MLPTLLLLRSRLLVHPEVPTNLRSIHFPTVLELITLHRLCFIIVLRSSISEMTWHVSPDSVIHLYSGYWCRRQLFGAVQVYLELFAFLYRFTPRFLRLPPSSPNM